MNRSTWLYVTVLLALIACSDSEQDSELSLVGKPVEIDLCMEGQVTTRAVTTLTSGTAYLNGGSSHMKPYTYSGGSFISSDPLVWTHMDMTITGYYADNGQTAVDNTLAYRIDYSSGGANGSFLSGQTSASYKDQTRVTITLRQQLARVYVTVRTEEESNIDNPKLRGIYTAGIYQGNLDTNGYAVGGSNNSGWEVSGSATTVGMSATTGTNVYHAIIIPQTVSAGTDFFSVDIDGLTGSFQLASTMTFKAGRQYNLALERMTHTLYLDSEVLVNDFVDPDTSTTVDTSNVTIQ